MRELEQTDNLKSHPYNEQEQIWRREAFKNIEADPSITARLVWGKLKSYWTPFLNVYAYPLPLVVLVAILVIGLYLLSPFGMFVLWQNETGRKFVILLVIQFVLATIFHIMIIANVRYRTPYVDPYLAIFSSIAVRHLALKFFPNAEFLKK